MKPHLRFDPLAIDASAKNGVSGLWSAIRKLPGRELKRDDVGATACSSLRG